MEDKICKFFLAFRTFVRDMKMEEVNYKGRRRTWANYRVGEGFIDERLDIFFGSTEWSVENEKEKVKHAFDHTMLLLDTNPKQPIRKSRFIYENRWIKRLGYSEVVQASWNITLPGSRMYQFYRKMKNVRTRLLELREKEGTNSSKQIAWIECVRKGDLEKSLDKVR